ncbi:MAG: hypothetical protein K0M47_11320, partial [Rhizobium sp.]|nr:hypothetical protein [Rhizobium sp.]
MAVPIAQRFQGFLRDSASRSADPARKRQPTCEVLFVFADGFGRKCPERGNYPPSWLMTSEQGIDSSHDEQEKTQGLHHPEIAGRRGDPHARTV